LEELHADAVGASGEGAEALETVVVNEPTFSETVDGYVDDFLGETKPVLDVEAFFAGEVTVAKSDDEFVTAELA